MAVVIGAAMLASLAAIPSAQATPGAEQWVAQYPGGAYGPDEIDGIAVSPDGSRVFVAGTFAHFTGASIEAVAYDAAGTLLWHAHYHGSGGYDDEVAGIGVSPDGSLVYVAGTSSTDTTKRDYITLAFDATTGTRIWKKRFSSTVGLSFDAAAALAVSPDGSRVFVTGAADGGPQGTDYVTVGYDALTGQQDWSARYAGPYRDNARTISVSPDGSAVFVSGFSVSNTGLDIQTISYDAGTGADRWQARYDGPISRDDQANAMAVSPDGSSVYVTGFSDGVDRHRDYVTVAYKTSNGTQRWARRYNGPADWNDNAKSIGVSPDGSRLFVTGYRTGQNGRDYETIAYSSAGARLWMRAYDGPGKIDDQATALGVSPDGTQVFVTGVQRVSFNDVQFGTVAYGADSAARLWQASLDGGKASALAVNPTGSAVYVAGINGPDFTTVAYSTS
jgi:DNA-binding beta-propeller fold protein YncE